MSRLSQKELNALKELRRRNDLPHLYGWRWYDWAYKFFTSTNRFNFLIAGNQLSKSSSQIRKAIHWATDQASWPSLWRTKPTQFWYLYPTKPVATTEFYEKWEPEFMPRGLMKNDPVYGWEIELKNKEIWAIHFKSGVSIYFKTYEQDAQNLQSGSVYAVFCDEELNPIEIFQELRSRLAATNGYFHMVFTPTIGLDYWRRVMEPANEQEEVLRDALKIRVSLYDCLKYKDGTPSFWTTERIKEIEEACSSEAEVQKRVYGRFVVSQGLKFQSFSRSENMFPKQKIPQDWHIYTGVDVGTGGENHPAAIVLIAVRPDYKFGVVFKGWRGDGVVTTTSDILEKHKELLTIEVPNRDGHLIKKQMQATIQSYDWHSKDFFTIASRAGVPFTPADKNRERGENMLNTLFKLKMLAIMDNDPELAKLVIELVTLQESTPKTRAVDDFVDALRYAVMPIPWDFDGVAGEIFKVEEEHVDKEVDERRTGYSYEKEEGSSIEDEFSEWQSLIDGQ